MRNRRIHLLGNNQRTASYTILLTLGSGSISEGFDSITAQLRHIEGSSDPEQWDNQFTGSLPANQELVEVYRNWNIKYPTYVSNGMLNSFLRNFTEIEIIGQPTNYSDEDLENSLEQLNQVSEDLIFQFQQWLDNVGFRENIYDELINCTQPNDDIKLVIATDDENIKCLPWHSWRFFDRRNKAGFSFSFPHFQQLQQSQTPLGKVRILAVFGDDTDLNTNADRQILQNLNDVKNAELVILRHQENDHLTVEVLDKALRDKQGWDIFFFAGHSDSQGGRGQMGLSPESLCSIEQLRFSFQYAISRGLQLAIFNSCSGLGFANQLQDLSMPQVIVMSREIPDSIAQNFLEEFLGHFSDGESFHLSVRHARETLLNSENEFPNASWLPVICQNPAAIPPTWNSLKNHGKLLWKIPITATAIVSTAVIGIRFLGGFQGLELAAYDYFMRSRPSENIDDRILLVVGDDPNKFPINDGTLVDVITTLDDHNPDLIGIDISREKPKYSQENLDFSQGKNDYQSLQKLFKDNETFIGICHHESDSNKYTAPPPQFFRENQRKMSLAYTNVTKDSGEILRRIPLTMTPDEDDPCYADHHLATLLGFRYLYNQGKKPQTVTLKTLVSQESRERIKIENVIFPKIPKHTGFYGKKNFVGYPLLINYRAKNNRENNLNSSCLKDKKTEVTGDIPFQLVTFDQVLNNQVKKICIKDKLVIVGMKISDQDRHLTPLSSQEESYGVIIVGHIVSQITSAVLDDRPLLKMFNFWQDSLLILIPCSLIGAVIGWKFREFKGWIIMTGIMIGVLYVGSYILFIEGGIILPLSVSVIILSSSSLVTFVYQYVGK